MIYLNNRKQFFKFHFKAKKKKIYLKIELFLQNWQIVFFFFYLRILDELEWIFDISLFRLFFPYRFLLPYILSFIILRVFCLGWCDFFSRIMKSVQEKKNVFFSKCASCGQKIKKAWKTRIAKLCKSDRKTPNVDIDSRPDIVSTKMINCKFRRNFKLKMSRQINWRRHRRRENK